MYTGTRPAHVVASTWGPDLCSPGGEQSRELPNAYTGTRPVPAGGSRPKNCIAGTWGPDPCLRPVEQDDRGGELVAVLWWHTTRVGPPGASI